MKKHICFLGTLISVTLLSVFSSCKKITDYILQHPDRIVKHCNIEQITFPNLPINYSVEDESYPYFMDTLTITYDKNDNPTEMHYTSSPERVSYFDWGLDRIFKYDSKNRLSVFIDGTGGPPRNGKISYMNLYYYTYQTDKIVYERMFQYQTVAVSELMTEPWLKELEKTYPSFEYRFDDFGRLIQSTQLLEAYPEHQLVTHYQYDSRGNLIKPGVTYSNKINIYQTNKVWMFLARDYSKNAQEEESITYNAYGLPEEFDLNDLYNCQTSFFFDIYSVCGNFTPRPVEKGKVTYQCKIP